MGGVLSPPLPIALCALSVLLSVLCCMVRTSDALLVHYDNGIAHVTEDYNGMFVSCPPAFVMTICELRVCVLLPRVMQ